MLHTKQPQHRKLAEPGSHKRQQNMVDHREFKAPQAAPAEQRSAEKAEQNTRVLWWVGFAVLLAAGLFFAFVR